MFSNSTRIFWAHTLCGLFLAALLCAANAHGQADVAKPRVIVTTDGEGDDQCSMVRFLLYANEWDLQGIVFSSSKHHWKGNDTTPGYKWLGMEWLNEQLEAYAAVYPNLVSHDPDFPTPALLRSKVFVGNIDLEGDMTTATPGSDHIVKVLLDPDTSPVWMQAWGGPNTIARALKTIEDEHPERRDEVARKARIFLIAQQDKTYQEYIAKVWPDITTLLSGYPAYGALSYRWKTFQPPEVLPYFEPEWLLPNIVEDHGPLTALYLLKKGKYRSEGDSPSFMYLINTGLRGSEHPSWGGWGGRFRLVSGATWKSDDTEGEQPHSIARWAVAFQNDWAARADWCVKSVANANHPPVVKLAHDNDVTARPGEQVTLDAAGSLDPDGDYLGFTWWNHREASTATNPPTIEGSAASTSTVRVPEDAKPGETFHVICSVSDDGSPVLTRYARVRITIAE